GPVHAGGLRGVGIKLVALDHPHAVVPPVDRARCWRLVLLVMMVIMAHALPPSADRPLLSVSGGGKERRWRSAYRWVPPARVFLVRAGRPSRGSDSHPD